MEKGVFVKDIVANAWITGIFAVGGAELGQARNGPFWKLTLSDASGGIDAKIWHPLSSSIQAITSGTLARISGRAALYRDQLQISLESFAPLDQEDQTQIDKRDFLPAGPNDPEQMFASLRVICLEEFRHKPWRRLVLGILDDADLSRALKFYPAAKSIHHAYVGGLLEHTLGVVKLCRAHADMYAELDRQTLLAGALLHDIGKIREFSGGFANDYTGEGRLLGHIFLGLEIIDPWLAKSGLEPFLAEHLRHLILSHHGELAFGAARLPQTAEAFALHYADNLDAKMAQCRNLAENADASGWSAWQSSLDRRIFTPAKTPEESRQRKPKREDDQCLSLLRE